MGNIWTKSKTNGIILHVGNYEFQKQALLQLDGVEKPFSLIKIEQKNFSQAQNTRHQLIPSKIYDLKDSVRGFLEDRDERITV